MLKRQRSVIGYPLQEVAEYRLREGIDANYPSMTADCNGPEDRFAVEPAFNGSAKYLVKDRELGLEYSLDPDLLREPDFNIVEWYRMQLEGSGIYNSLYLAETLEFIETTRIELNSVFETLSDGLGEDLPSLESIPDPSQDSIRKNVECRFLKILSNLQAPCK